MRTRVALVTVVLLAWAPVSAYAGGQSAAQLVVTGSGGQTAVLAVGRGGVDVQYPSFPARVPGPDGAVGGVAIQDAHGGLVGGVLVQNVPGFTEAIAIGLVDFQSTHLRPGRYRLTLLGTGRQTVALKGVSARLVAHGPARPVTRAHGAATGTVATWSDSLGAVRSGDIVMVGNGSGGDEQQADTTEECLSIEGQPCAVPPVGLGLSPGPGSWSFWSTSIYGAGSLPAGRYVYSGNQVAVGPASTTGHAEVVISLRR